MTDQLKHGDRVYVTDPALAAMRAIMRNATGEEPTPNHYGTVERLMDDGQVLIHFDDGVGAPYPPDLVRVLEPPVVANQRRVRTGGLMRCCLATLAEATHETLPGDVLACKYEPDNGQPQLVVAVDGIWEWNR